MLTGVSMCKRRTVCVVLTALTTLNVLMARYVFRTHSTGPLPKMAARPPSQPKTRTSLHVIQVGDIHPIEHLQEAERLAATVAMETAPKGQLHEANTDILSGARTFFDTSDVYERGQGQARAIGAGESGKQRPLESPPNKGGSSLFSDLAATNYPPQVAPSGLAEPLLYKEEQRLEYTPLTNSNANDEVARDIKESLLEKTPFANLNDNSGVILDTKVGHRENTPFANLNDNSEVILDTKVGHLKNTPLTNSNAANGQVKSLDVLPETVPGHVEAPIPQAGPRAQELTNDADRALLSGETNPNQFYQSGNGIPTPDELPALQGQDSILRSLHDLQPPAGAAVLVPFNKQPGMLGNPTISGGDNSSPIKNPADLMKHISSNNGNNIILNDGMNPKKAAGHASDGIPNNGRVAQTFNSGTIDGILTSNDQPGAFLNTQSIDSLKSKEDVLKNRLKTNHHDNNILSPNVLANNAENIPSNVNANGENAPQNKVSKVNGEYYVVEDKKSQSENAPKVYQQMLENIINDNGLGDENEERKMLAKLLQSLQNDFARNISNSNSDTQNV